MLTGKQYILLIQNKYPKCEKDLVLVYESSHSKIRECSDKHFTEWITKNGKNVR